MEENIRILETYLKNSAYKEKDSDFFKNGGWEVVDLEIPQAIENLIKGYREKEESENYLYDAYQDAGKKMFEYSEKCDELEEKLKIATAMLTKGTYPSKNEEDNDFDKQFVPKSKIKELKEKNEKQIDAMRQFKHSSPFDFGLLNGIDDCCRTLLDEKLKIN